MFSEKRIGLRGWLMQIFNGVACVASTSSFREKAATFEQSSDV
jgi:hypothetical protein